MAISSATVTMNLADLLGVDFDIRRTKVRVSTNIPGNAVIDTVGNQIRLGTGNVTLNADGTASLSTWIPGTGANPASWQTYVNVDYRDSGSRERVTRTFGPFTITGNTDLADLVAEQEIPPTYLSAVTAQLDAIAATSATASTSAAASATSAAASAALAKSISGISTPDSLVAALVPTSSASATSAAIAASTVQKYQTTTVGQSIQQLIAASADAGGFYENYDHSQVFQDGVHDPIKSWGYNTSAARGRVNPSYGALMMAIEGRYKNLGDMTQEWYVQHVPASGHAAPGGGVGYRRPIMFNIMENGQDAGQPYIQGHVCATRFTFLEQNMATEVMYYDAAGLHFTPGHDLYVGDGGSGNSKIMWQVAGTTIAYQTAVPGDMSVYMWDAVNNRAHARYKGGVLGQAETRFYDRLVVEAGGVIFPRNDGPSRPIAASSVPLGTTFLDANLMKLITAAGSSWYANGAVV